MTCDICEMIEKREGDVLYSDPYLHIILPESAAVKGHVRVYPKKHVGSLDGLDEDETLNFLKAGSIASSHLFEHLGAHGTNMVLNEGRQFGEHFSMEILVRKEEDGLNFQWDPKELQPAEMDSVMKKIKDKADLIGAETQESISHPEGMDSEKIIADENKDNYLLKQLDKLP